MSESNDISLEFDCDKNFYDLDLTGDGSDLLAAVNGDSLNTVDEDLLGSKLWLLLRQKTLDSNLPRIEQFARDSLQWLIDDNVAESVTVFAEYTSKIKGIMKVTVQVVRLTGEDRKFEYVWNQQLV
jgi:phage gp46-like protein